MPVLTWGRFLDHTGVCISVDETTTKADIDAILAVFADAKGVAALPFTIDEIASKVSFGTLGGGAANAMSVHNRATPFLQHSNFSSFHTETEMLRYIHGLAAKDLGLQVNNPGQRC